MRATTALILVAAAGVLLAGCATDPGSGGATDSGDATAPTDSASTPMVSRSDLVTTTPTPRATRLTGRIVEGVEAGCVVLRSTDGGTYTLVGNLSSVPTDADVVVLEGRLDPELLSHCQQGPVFVVTSVSAG